MIELKEHHLIGQGFHRKCYIHPDNHNFCIKINTTSSTKENAREHALYRRLEKRNISWKHLARYHGEIYTNHGNGHIYDLIKDENQKPSKTLEYYLKNGIPDGTTLALKNMEQYLLDNAIITTTLKPRNIVLQKSSNSTLNAVIIDDIGNTEFIPISNVSNYFARLKIKRKLRRFRRDLKQCFKHGSNT